LAIGKLIDAGRFELDTRAIELVDLQRPTYDPKISVRQLLSHTSGMPDYLDESLYEDMDDIELAIPGSKLREPKDYLPLFPHIDMKSAPGASFAYNNGAYIYLAMIVAAVSGMTYGQFINDNLLKPIDIHRGGVHAFNAMPSNAAHGYVEEGGQWVTNIYKLPIQAGGDGGIWLSAPEMHRLWQAFAEGEIISPVLVQEFMKSHAAVNPDRGIHYGLGLWLKCKPGGFEPYIVGSDAGVSFKSSYNTGSRLFVFAASNTSNGVWDLSSELNVLSDS